MKVRRTLFTALITLSAVFTGSTAMAETQSSHDAFTKITRSFVDTAVAATTSELKQNILTDVLTASYHVTPDEEDVTYVAKVEVKDLKDEG
jgi:uncharacterized membrane protein